MAAVASKRPARGGELSVRAFAKINLTLRVTRRRDDGYHEVRTVLQSLALHDTLTFVLTRGPFRIDCDDPLCPTDQTNLVWRAAEHVWRAAGRRGAPRDVAVRIDKRIPIQAGLGGGSSDAAATIHALNRCWRANLSPDRQREIAASLGSDVPFFLFGGTMLGVERGEVLFRMADLPESWVTIVIPAFGVSSRDAYAWWDEVAAPVRSESAAGSGSRAETVGARSVTKTRGVVRVPTALAPFVPPGELRNDLQPAVARRHPEITRLVRALLRAGATYAAMTGSGSAVFGMFPSRTHARNAALAATSPSSRSLVTRTAFPITSAGRF
jgi:4-diphosphocytidyl-2-C-methyl-D-erythritol kinase